MESWVQAELKTTDLNEQCMTFYRTYTHVSFVSCTEGFEVVYIIEIIILHCNVSKRFKKFIMEHWLYKKNN